MSHATIPNVYCTLSLDPEQKMRIQRVLRSFEGSHVCISVSEADNDNISNEVPSKSKED